MTLWTFLDNSENFRTIWNILANFTALDFYPFLHKKYGRINRLLPIWILYLLHLTELHPPLYFLNYFEGPWHKFGVKNLASRTQGSCHEFYFVQLIYAIVIRYFVALAHANTWVKNCRNMKWWTTLWGKSMAKGMVPFLTTWCQYLLSCFF